MFNKNETQIVDNPLYMITKINFCTQLIVICTIHEI
jgi:hypothetical protein